MCSSRLAECLDCHSALGISTNSRSSSGEKCAIECEEDSGSSNRNRRARLTGHRRAEAAGILLLPLENYSTQILSFPRRITPRHRIGAQRLGGNLPQQSNGAIPDRAGSSFIRANEVKHAPRPEDPRMCLTSHYITNLAKSHSGIARSFTGPVERPIEFTRKRDRNPPRCITVEKAVADQPVELEALYSSPESCQTSELSHASSSRSLCARSRSESIPNGLGGVMKTAERVSSPDSSLAIRFTTK